MAHISPINKKTERDLEILKKAKLLRGFYLAGGTGLAFLLEHRESHDLDFFRKTTFDEWQRVTSLRRMGKFSLEKKAEGTVRGQFRTTLVSFFHYPYPLLEKLKIVSGVSIASVADIACMKLDTIASRGTKRDFIDLYVIATSTDLALPKLFKLFSKKYRSLNYNTAHIKKSLVYFQDAEDDPMPRMIIPLDWKLVKKFFVEEVKKL